MSKHDSVWTNYSGFVKVVTHIPKEQTGVIHEFIRFGTEENESTDDH